MNFCKGQIVLVHFPGNEVEARIMKVGNGELLVLEEGALKPEWVPLAWCRFPD